jgi:ribosomal protein S18 acetylase RimI-like enzyme
MRIRPAIEADAPALARVIVDSGRAAHRGQMPAELLNQVPLAEAYAESERNWRHSLRDIAAGTDPREQIFVAEDVAAGVVGLTMCGPSRTDLVAGAGEVYVLYILPEHARHGIGRQLVQIAATHLADHGLRALVIGCLAANTPARCFYEAMGGRVIAERMFDQDGTPLPEVVYGWNDTATLVGAVRPGVV